MTSDCVSVMLVTTPATAGPPPTQDSTYPMTKLIIISRNKDTRKEIHLNTTDKWGRSKQLDYKLIFFLTFRVYHPVSQGYMIVYNVKCR